MKTAITCIGLFLLIGVSACKEDETGKSGMEAPVINIKNISSSEVSFTVTVSEAAKEGKLYYGIIREDDPEPSAQEIVDDKVYYREYTNLSGRTSVLLKFSQLTYGKTYYLYSAVELGSEVSNLSAKHEVKVE